MKNKIRIYGPALAYMLLIFILSSFPSLKPPDLRLNIEDKLAHIMEYAILGILLSRAALTDRKPSLKLMSAVFVIGTAYGASDEMHQYFVPNRFASVWDGLADAAGVLAGQLVYWIRRNRAGVIIG
jgi:VanZ family protein